jgi:hypothetical protein
MNFEDLNLLEHALLSELDPLQEVIPSEHTGFEGLIA